MKEEEIKESDELTELEEDFEKLPLPDVLEILKSIDNKKIIVGSNIRYSYKYQRALKVFAENDGFYPLVLIDNTFWGSVRKGCLITTATIYATDSNGIKQIVELTPATKIESNGPELQADRKPIFCFKKGSGNEIEKIAEALKILISSEDLYLK